MLNTSTIYYWFILYRGLCFGYLFWFCTYTGTSKTKLNIMKKVNIFCHSFQKVKPIYYIDLLHSKTFKAFISLNLDYGLPIIKPQNSVSHKIRILHKIIFYTRYFKQKCQASEKYVNFYVRRRLGPPFAWITCINAVWQRQSVCGTAEVVWKPMLLW